MERLHPDITYSPDDEQARLTASGASVRVTPVLLAMAEDKDGIEITGDIFSEPLNALFDESPRGPVRVSLSIEPIEKDEVHDFYGNDDD